MRRVQQERQRCKDRHCQSNRSEVLNCHSPIWPQHLKRPWQNVGEEAHHKNTLSARCATNEPECNPADPTVNQDIHYYQWPPVEDRTCRHQPGRFVVPRMQSTPNCEHQCVGGEDHRHSRSRAGSEQPCWSRCCQALAPSNLPNYRTRATAIGKTAPSLLRGWGQYSVQAQIHCGFGVMVGPTAG